MSLLTKCVNQTTKRSWRPVENILEQNLFRQIPSHYQSIFFFESSEIFKAFWIFLNYELLSELLTPLELEG